MTLAQIATSPIDSQSTASVASVSAAVEPRLGFAFKYEELDRMFAFADANGLQDELFHVVATLWNKAKLH